MWAYMGLYGLLFMMYGLQGDSPTNSTISPTGCGLFALAALGHRLPQRDEYSDVICCS